MIALTALWLLLLTTAALSSYALYLYSTEDEWTSIDEFGAQMSALSPKERG